MNTRKKSLKILALILSVALMGIGAAPAKADCSKDCCCKVPSKIQLQDISSIHQVTRHMQEYAKMHDGSHQVHTFYLLVQSDTGRSGCQEGATRNACEVAPFYSHDALAGVIKTAPRAENIVYAHTAVNAGIVESGSPFSGLAAGNGRMVRAGPQPLYLQNLSLLI
jgi:hypothetical protein